MIVNVDFKKTIIFIKSQEKIIQKDLKCEIWKSLIFNNKILVLFNTTTALDNQNIICFNEQGEELWKIQDPDTYRPGKSKTASPFTGMSVDHERGVLKARNWNDHVYDVALSTGRLLLAHYSRG